MKFGLCTLANKDATVDHVVEVAAAAGYDGVEIWGEGHAQDASGETSLAECERIAGVAEAASIDIATYGSYLCAGSAEFDTEVERELDAAAALGAPTIRVWAGDGEYQDRSESSWERVVEDLQSVAGEAVRRGLTVTVEKHQGTVTNTLLDARRLLDAVDRPNCGLNYQPLFSLPDSHLQEEAQELATYTNQIHLQAVSEQCANDRSPLSDAYFDLDRLLGTFEEVGFDGYANVEFVTADVPFEETIADDLAYVQSILGE